jgi:hypothetical protein
MIAMSHRLGDLGTAFVSAFLALALMFPSFCSGTATRIEHLPIQLWNISH